MAVMEFRGRRGQASIHPVPQRVLSSGALVTWSFLWSFQVTPLPRLRGALGAIVPVGALPLADVGEPSLLGTEFCWQEQ